MGLITKEVTAKWNSNTKKHFIKKGYIYTKGEDEFTIKVSDLSKHSHYLVDIQCDNCEIIKKLQFREYNKRLKNGSYYCASCELKLYGSENSRIARLKKSISLRDWLFENLSEKDYQEIISRWDYEKNKHNPDEVSFSSIGENGHGFWLKCLDNKNHESEQKRIYNFCIGRKGSILCNQCNSIYCKNPELVKYFLNIEDSKIYSAGSKVKVDLKCPICGYIKNFNISTLKRYGFSCPKCNDGISYPNKFAFNFLEQLKINFIPEYSQPWSDGRKYDFFFNHNNKSYILEMDGSWHFNDNSLSGQTKEKSHEIDVWKDDVAERHGIKVIRIDCKESEIEYIKNSIENSLLFNIFDLSHINWNECEKYTLTNLLKSSCDIWLEFHNIKKIIEKLKLGENTIRRYLKRGAKYGLCDYGNSI